MLAPAKLNVMLHVVARRGDGYHLLQSLVMFADIGDEVSVLPAADFSLQVEGEFAGALADTQHNLITKAAHALAQAHSIAPSGRISLRKNLPIGAGLGGGSSDAATALTLLSELWKRPIPADLAASLGSDIPACLHATPLWMEGVGEQVTPVLLPFNVHALLANPRIPVLAADAYRALTPPYDAPIQLPASFHSADSLFDFLHTTRNALETPASTLAPVITEVLVSLAELPNCRLARMSGSGSTCFALFSTRESCEHAASLLQAARPDWWVRPCILRGSHGQA